MKLLFVLFFCSIFILIFYELILHCVNYIWTIVFLSALLITLDSMIFIFILRAFALLVKIFLKIAQRAERVLIFFFRLLYRIKICVSDSLFLNSGFLFFFRLVFFTKFIVDLLYFFHIGHHLFETTNVLCTHDIIAVWEFLARELQQLLGLLSVSHF